MNGSTQRPIVRPHAPSVLVMTAPLVISFWMRALFTFVDTIFAATIGDAAVAAIGLTIPFEYLMIALWVGMSTGLTSCLSRAMGAGQSGKIAQYLAVARKMVLATVPIMMAIGGAIWLFADRLRLAPEVAAAFAVYGSVLIAGSALTSFWSILPDSIIKAHQDTRSTMWAGIWSNLINVTLNVVFVFVFKWGIFGIAFSTILGRFGGLAYALVRARMHEARRIAAETEVDARLDPSPYRSILALSIPAAATFTLMSVETALLNGLLARLEHPTEAIAAYSIYVRVLLFALNPVIAAGVALLPFTAKRFGEEDMPGLRRGIREVGWAVVVYCAVFVMPLMWLVGPAVAGWLSESPQTAEYATVALKFVPLACFTMAPFLLCRPVFEGMQRGRPGLYMSLLRYVVLSIPMAIGGIWIARGSGLDDFYGLVGGVIVATIIASAVFAAWLVTSLRKGEADPGRHSVQGDA